MFLKQQSVLERQSGPSTRLIRPGFLFSLALAFITVGGCTKSANVSVIRIIDHRHPGATERFRESFQEAWYDLDEHGNVDIVLRRSARPHEDTHSPLDQVVHIRSVWRSIPGRTPAQRTQINGTITYYLVSGRTGTAYDGAGSVFFREKRGRLVGAIELAKLRPTRHLVSSSPLFARAEISGEFTALRNRRRVVQLVNEMNQLFGPAPPFQPDTNQSR